MACPRPALPLPPRTSVRRLPAVEGGAFYSLDPGGHVAPAQHFDVKTWKPEVHGPTWTVGPDGNYILPERTLGLGVAAWIMTWLVNDEGGPWMPTAEQLRFILWLYAVDPDGRFTYQDAVLQRLKGHGKNPLAAAICLAEMLGPVRFSHFDEDGQAVGKECLTAHVQLAAVSQAQSANTMDLFPRMIPDRTRKHFDIEMNSEKLRALGHSRKLEIITSSPRSQEGARPTFVILDEIQHWISSNGGHGLYKVITRNRTKSKGGAARSLAVTNAYQPGEDSILERIRENYEKTITINPVTGKPYLTNPRRLYDSLEAPSSAPLDAETARAVVKVIRGDSVWLDIESIVTFIEDKTNPESESRRFWYNQITSDEETLIPPHVWDPAGRDDITLQKDDEIVLGFDGSRSKDATALVAIRIRDQAIVPIRIWERDTSVEKWEVPRDEVNGAVDYCFSHYQVRAFFSDVYPWESYIDLWANKYRAQLMIKATPQHSIGYNMSGHQEELTLANARLIGAIHDQNVVHNKDSILKRHVMNARRTFNQYGMYFTKDGRENDKYNDAYAASLLAFLALQKYLESGKRPKAPHNGKVHLGLNLRY